jgi:succinoglycan biosynthesis protein ExoU
MTKLSEPEKSTINSVCVIIAAYNAEKTIASAIKSALAEKEVTEVVVVDDSSSDDTVANSHAADDNSGRLKILTQSVNSGPSAARNRAISESNSLWISILDSDDFFIAGRIKKLLAFVDKADFIADDMLQVPEYDVNSQGINLLGDNIKEPKLINFREFVLSNVTKEGKQRAELGFIKPLMNRKFLADNAITYQENMRLGEDFELYARALALGARLIITPTQGYVSVVRQNSLSGNHTETDLLNLRNCDKIIINDCNLNRIDKNALRQHYLSIECRLQWRLLIIAIKNRNLRQSINSFLHPYPVPLYLAKKLISQIFIRAFRKNKIQGIEPYIQLGKTNKTTIAK